MEINEEIMINLGLAGESIQKVQNIKENILLKFKQPLFQIKLLIYKNSYSNINLGEKILSSILIN